MAECQDGRLRQKLREQGGPKIIPERSLHQRKKKSVCSTTIPI